MNIPRCYSSQSSHKSLNAEEVNMKMARVAKSKFLMDTLTHLESDLGTCDERVLIRLSVAQRCVRL